MVRIMTPLASAREWTLLSLVECGPFVGLLRISFPRSRLPSGKARLFSIDDLAAFPIRSLLCFAQVQAGSTPPEHCKTARY
jgi:hypothetical protein